MITLFCPGGGHTQLTRKMVEAALRRLPIEPGAFHHMRVRIAPFTVGGSPLAEEFVHADGADEAGCLAAVADALKAEIPWLCRYYPGYPCAHIKVTPESPVVSAGAESVARYARQLAESTAAVNEGRSSAAEEAPKLLHNPAIDAEMAPLREQLCKLAALNPAAVSPLMDQLLGASPAYEQLRAAAEQLAAPEQLTLSPYRRVDEQVCALLAESAPGWRVVSTHAANLVRLEQPSGPAVILRISPEGEPWNLRLLGAPEWLGVDVSDVEELADELAIFAAAAEEEKNNK